MDVQDRWRIVRIALTSLYLMVGWILFSGTLSPRSLFVGGIFSFLVSLLTYEVFIDDTEAARRALLPRIHWAIFYLGYLLLDVYVASFRVLAMILRQRIQPRIVHFRTRLHSDIARMILAQSITLTPGTVVLDLTDDHFVIHWLNAETTHSRHAGERIKGRMEAFLQRIWI